jgi:hypothetical protein
MGCTLSTCDVTRRPSKEHPQQHPEARRGYLTIFVDDGEPVARCTPFGAGHYGLSFHNHTSRWEPMPIIADLTRLAHGPVGVRGPHLQRWDFPDTKSGSHH